MHILTHEPIRKSKEHLRATQTKPSCQKNKNLNFLFQTTHVFEVSCDGKQKKYLSVL